MRKPIIGVMGPGDKAREEDKKAAFALGALIAKEGWILLSGGRNQGVMDASCKGAKSEGGTVLGILPSKDNSLTSDAVDIPVLTGMGSARNYINILTSNVIIACGMGAGTASEISLALKSKKHVVLLNSSAEAVNFFQNLAPDLVSVASSPEDAIALTQKLLKKLTG